MGDVVRITVPGDVVPWARAGKSGKGHYTPDRQRNYMGAIRQIATEAMGDRPLFDGPIAFKFLAIYAWPASYTKKRRAAVDGGWKFTKPDATNLQKLPEDAMNGIVWTDDAVIAHWSGWKVYGPKPGLVIEIESLEGVAPPMVSP